jgi:type VI secretion system protein ImpL
MAGGAPNDVAIEKSRIYLNGFNGYEHIYLNMIAGANRRFKDFTFNERFPGSSNYIVDKYRVQDAFSKDGYAFMQNAFSHPNAYFGGEEWVLKAKTPTPEELVKLSDDLKRAYTADYIKAWRDYLNSASYVPTPFGYKDLVDAGNKLGALDVDTSPLLELFSLLSVNTAAASPEIAAVFQTPQKVVSPSSPEQHLIGGSNQKYMTDLKNLEQAIKIISIDTTKDSDPNAAAPIIPAAVTAELDTKDLVPRPQPGSVEQKSFDLLEAPIKAAENLAQQVPLKAAGAGAKAFCDQQIAPLLKEFPFKPDATTEATTEEVAQVFAPGSGSFAKYISTLQLFVTQQGPQFYSAQPTKVPVNPAFLSFLGKAQRISSALFPPGSNKPSLDFTLTEPPGAPNAVLTVDDQKISTDGQKVQFRWESRPDGKTSIALEGNSRTPPGGPWSVFHLGFVAEHNPPNRLKYNLQTNNQTNGVALFDASGPGAELLNKDFMKGFQCVSNVAR